MNTLNFNYIGGDNSNVGLRGTPVKLTAKQLVGCRPDGDGWEEVWDETFDLEKHRTRIKMRGSRKQKAARMMVPRATVTIVPKLEVQDPTVVQAVLMEKSPDEIRILQLEAEIRKLMGLL